MDTNKIIEYARECVGTKFRHQGRICGRSLDCAGVVIHVAIKLGLSVNDVKAYGRNPCNGLLESSLENQTCIKEVEEMLPGDILLMRFNQEPQHLAILTGKDTIIHGYSNVGMVCEHRFSSVWKSRVVKIYRFIE